IEGTVVELETPWTHLVVLHPTRMLGLQFTQGREIRQGEQVLRLDEQVGIFRLLRQRARLVYGLVQLPDEEPSLQSGALGGPDHLSRPSTLEEEIAHGNGPLGAAWIFLPKQGFGIGQTPGRSPGARAVEMGKVAFPPRLQCLRRLGRPACKDLLLSRCEAKFDP